MKTLQEKYQLYETIVNKPNINTTLLLGIINDLDTILKRML